MPDVEVAPDLDRELTPLLELRRVSKSFPGVRAVEDVDFAVRAGEVVSVVGENGAGKSTLVKIVAGIYPSGTYDGDILLRGEKENFHSVYDAEGKGIVLVPQELHVAPNLSIAENMFAGRLPGRRGLVDEDELYERTQFWLTAFEIPARPFALAAVLTPPEQRQVVIAAALSKEAKVLILDEPTASLSEGETQRLFGYIQRLKESMVGIVYISHRLDEIERVGDSVVVMRNGRVVRRFSRADMDHREIVRAMIGRAPDTSAPRSVPMTTPEPIMSINEFEVYDAAEPSVRRVKGVSFALHKGEILGLFGLVGAGRTELARALFGNWPGRVNGRFELEGAARIPRSPAEAIRLGMAMLTEDRRKTGVVAGQSVNANISLASIRRVSGRFRIRKQQEDDRNRGLVERLRIVTPSLSTWIDHLSGGNQQKTIVARWLAAAPRVLILDEPTTGVDVGARAELYGLFRALADEGRGVLLISSDLEEVITQCDRILVMYKGEIRHEFVGAANRQAVMLSATGGEDQ